MVFIKFLMEGSVFLFVFLTFYVTIRRLSLLSKILPQFRSLGMCIILERFLLDNRVLSDSPCPAKTGRVVGVVRGDVGGRVERSTESNTLPTLRLPNHLFLDMS